MYLFVVRIAIIDPILGFFYWILVVEVEELIFCHKKQI
jgi:hypothetical protein